MNEEERKLIQESINWLRWGISPKREKDECFNAIGEALVRLEEIMENEEP